MSRACFYRSLWKLALILHPGTSGQDPAADSVTVDSVSGSVWALQADKHKETQLLCTFKDLFQSAGQWPVTELVWEPRDVCGTPVSPADPWKWRCQLCHLLTVVSLMLLWIAYCSGVWTLIYRLALLAISSLSVTVLIVFTLVATPKRSAAIKP